MARELASLAIRSIAAWEALDSRGNPTVACTVTLVGGAVGRAVVPSGASTGRHEAPEWRDGGPRMGGRGVRGAIEMIETHLLPALLGANAADTTAVDRLISMVAAPPDRRFLGSNTTLAVSVASARAGAAAMGLPLWRLLAPPGPAVLPLPMIQILGGGVHAGWVIDLQDVLAIPVGARSFAEAIEMVWRVRDVAVSTAEARGYQVRVGGDEGGLAIPFATNRLALEFVTHAIDEAGLEGDVWLGIDVAAGQLVDASGQYRLRSEDRTLERDAWIDEIGSWVRSLPVRSIEDPLDDDDWDGWRYARGALGVPQLIGDDHLVTDVRRLRRAVDAGTANAVLVKPNQRGTLSAAADVIQFAKASRWHTIVSARSGDTEDDWLADLAVGWQAGQIKVGSLSRSERTAKWNRLLEIEATSPGATLARPFTGLPTPDLVSRGEDHRTEEGAG